MKYKFFLLLFVISLQYSCKKDDTLSSFAMNNKKIEDSNDNLNIKNESFLEAIYIQADKDDSLIPRKEKAKRVHEIGIDLYKYIDDLKSVIKKKNTTTFVNELFFNGDDISTEGKEFLLYIKNYRSSMITTLRNSNPRIVGMVNNNFGLDVIEDRRGQKTNWLTLNFKDFSPIISITKLSSIQSDIRRIETQYLAELLGVTLNSGDSKKIISKIKKTTAKTIGENIKPVPSKKAEPIKTPVKKAEKKKEIKKPVVKKEPKKTSNNKYHVVKKGETIYRIATNNGISIAKLKKLNGMTNNNLVIGQKLKVK